MGESLLLFFYPPSGDLGLTTTVGGDQGRISLASSQPSVADLARQLSDVPARFAPERQKPRPKRGLRIRKLLVE